MKHKTKKVHVGSTTSITKAEEKKSAMRTSRLSYSSTIQNDIFRAIAIRDAMKVIERIDGVDVDCTPKSIPVQKQVDRFSKLRSRLENQSMQASGSYISMRSGRSSSSTSRSTSMRIMMGGMKLSMEELIGGIGSVHMMDAESSSLSSITSFDAVMMHPLKMPLPYKKPFIKVVLRKTAPIILYTQRSYTALRGTDEGNEVEADNKQYEYLTVGKGKIRRRSEVDAQTVDVLCKTRPVNTNYVETADQSTYVSNFDMYDTYTLLKSAIESVGIARMPPTSIIPVRRPALWEQYYTIARSPQYKMASMIMKRLLSGNEFAKEQQRFRNMNMVTRMATKVNFRYTLNILFRSGPDWQDGERKAVSDISFCKRNGDIFAVAYGVFSMSSMHVPESGMLGIWSIKNPCDPERSYLFTTPAVSVEFSAYEPSLVAVGLYDGSVQVFDISSPISTPVAVSRRSAALGCDPMTSIKWIKQTESTEAGEIDPFIVLSEDGTVYKFRIINSPYLSGFKQMVLERVEGMPEGLNVHTSEPVAQQANRHPQGLSMTMHPHYPDLYYVLTDEGCVYKCSLNYPNQYLQLLKTHDGSVNTMDFSPWSPKLFLTCGNDWFIRIWVDGIFKPLITLRHHMAPIHCAFWSRTNSTIIVSLNRKSFDIWDISKTILKPVSTRKLDSSFNTMAKFSLCGRSVAVGNERGNVIMCSLDDMPFSAHFQYDELEKAIYKAISDFPDLMFELKSIGYFGYPKKRFVNPN